MGVVWEIAAAREKLFTFESGAVRGGEERRVLAVSFSHFALSRGGRGKGRVCATRPFDAPNDFGVSEEEKEDCPTTEDEGNIMRTTHTTF